jgi:pimeloyl-ACP methyl ester carboxylesterase
MRLVSTTTAGGRRLDYFTLPAARRRAPAVLMLSGIAGPCDALLPVARQLAPRARLLALDPAGLFSAQPEARARHGAHEPPAHHGADALVGDVGAVLDAESVDRVAIVGWCTGAQLAIEVGARLAPRVRALVLVNGAARGPIEALGRLPTGARALSWLLERGERRLLRPRTPEERPNGAGRTLGDPAAVEAWLRRLGLVGPSADPTLLARVVDRLASTDPLALVRAARSLASRDVTALCARVEAPTLILAGERDPLAPSALAHATGRLVLDSEVRVVRGACHYLPLEYPDLVGLRIERFLEHAEALAG